MLIKKLIKCVYPANVDYSDLPKQKKTFPDKAGVLSVYKESIILISRLCSEKKSSHIGRYLLLMVLFRL